MGKSITLSKQLLNFHCLQDKRYITDHDMACIYDLVCTMFSQLWHLSHQIPPHSAKSVEYSGCLLLDFKPITAQQHSLNSFAVFQGSNICPDMTECRLFIKIVLLGKHILLSFICKLSLKEQKEIGGDRSLLRSVSIILLRHL